jgi:general secretion pathway protein E
MFEISEPIRRLIMERADAGQIKQAARAEGMVTLRDAAVRKMLDGVTSFEQVIAVTRED